MSIDVIVYLTVATAAAALSFLLTRTRPQSVDRGASLIPVRTPQRRLLRDLPTALRNGDIFLVYQPKLHLRSGEVSSVEALVRWNHHVLGSISRKSLIPLAEERGQMRELTIWVLRQALTDQARLAASGRAIGISINVSASLLTDPEFVRDLCALAGLAGGEIGLEITETALIETSPIALTNLERITKQGIAISIDDYGSGLSSLAYLKQLPAKELKIDKMFVSGMTLSHRDPLIVRSTIDLAHALGLTVVAEGVESLATLALLKVMGCDYAQGFLISTALPIAALEAFLEAANYSTLLSDASASVSPPNEFWVRVGRDKQLSDKVAAAG